MSSATSSIPLFDADNHLYETREAFTKFLPERHRGAIDYVDVDELEGLDDESIRKIMGGNLAHLMNVSEVAAR